MLQRIQNDENTLYPIGDFEDYHEIGENSFLIMSYFHNNDINEDMCQWNLAEKITNEAAEEFFKPIKRLGSSYIYFEHEDLQFWKETATAVHKEMESVSV